MSDDFLRGYAAGAKAALEYMASEWPDLGEDTEYPAPTTVTAAHIEDVLDLLRAVA